VFSAIRTAIFPHSRAKIGTDVFSEILKVPDELAKFPALLKFSPVLFNEFLFELWKGGDVSASAAA
jgi:hypothetical protein